METPDCKKSLGGDNNAKYTHMDKKLNQTNIGPQSTLENTTAKSIL
jgi:hypothetical protein